MPTKRTILANLTTPELRNAVDECDLHVDDRRVRVQLVDTLARSRSARIDSILLNLKRVRLKALCRALDVDDSGREKAQIVARLFGSKAAPRGDGDAPPRKAGRPAPVKDEKTDQGPEPKTRLPGPEAENGGRRNGVVRTKDRKRGVSAVTATNGNIGWIANYIWGIRPRHPARPLRAGQVPRCHSPHDGTAAPSGSPATSNRG